MHDAAILARKSKRVVFVAVGRDGSTVVWRSRFGTAGGRAALFSEPGSDIAMEG